MTDGTRVIKKRTRKNIKIPYEFFERHLSEANADYLRIYLYAYYVVTRDETELSNRVITEKLNVSKEQIEAAWDYFHQVGLVSIEENSIEFLDLDTVYKAGKQATASTSRKQEEAVRFLSGNTGLKKQIAHIELQLGGEISHKDLEELYSLFVEHQVPFDVVAAATGHCVSKGIRNVTYVSKVALEWFSKGLTDYEKIEAYLGSQGNAKEPEPDKYARMKEIFPFNRDFYEIEKKYLDTWTEQDGATIEQIKDAIDKTILNTGKVNFPYLDKVIKSTLSADYRKPSPPPAYGKKNAFHNFSQSGFDYDKISEALRSKQSNDE